ncbi:DUF5953 family protein [Archangium primigenium]|uniref:DUF5953 family protein n=1 Tax=[Archangium] primigenium TaxID=2792470 RepID=UPI00195B6A39|nr:DUF5953 family protein [Archangium primigenium]MBM7117293.1 hypothetical protein [Archangium primigenium]
MPATQHDELAMIVYAPGSVGTDGRPMAVVHGMERTFPGLRLEWTTSKEGQRTLLTERDAWLAQKKWVGEFPLLHNGDLNAYVSVAGWQKPAHSAPGGQAWFEVHAVLPFAAEGIAAAPEVLEAVAESARAFWGLTTPFKASVDIARQTKNRPDDLRPPPRGLPVLKSPSAMPSPEIPHRLGWLNYWSAAAARALGFPDPTRDEDLLARSRRTVSGGWIVRLTEAPLDLDNPAHLDALKRAYERFPEIGGRTTA